MRSVFKSIVLCLYLAISMSACAQDETSSERIMAYETCCGADSV